VIGRKTPSTFDLRVFAALLCPFCGVVAKWIGSMAGVSRLGWWVALAVAPVSVLGVIKPDAIRGVYSAWTAVTTPIGRLLSLLLLGVIYFGVVTPMGWALRLFGIDPASRRWLPESKSYWVDRSAVTDDSLFHPF
jgi:uncharacterized membrane protein